MSQTVTAPTNAPVEVVYGTATVVGGTPPVTVSCSPPSGSTFPIGTTQVTCTATDAQQRVSTCGLTVTVEPPPQITVTRFAAFGDSITLGEDGNLPSLTLPGLQLPAQTVVLMGSEYPTVLQNELRSRYSLQAASITVANLGLPAELVGDSTTLARFSREAVAGGYQVILLMEGSNDVNEAYYSSGVSAIQAAVDNLRIMVRQSRAAGQRPYLATIPPMNPNSPCVPRCRGAGAPLVPGYNDRVRGLAASEALPLVDVYEAFGGDLTLISTDGLHPNAAGYQRIADTFFAAIKATLE